MTSASGLPPHQLAALRAAAPAEPAAQPFWFAVAMEALATASTGSLPAARRHVGESAAQRPGADLEALALPDLVVAVTRADQGVGDLVQDGVADLLDGIIALDEIDR